MPKKRLKPIPQFQTEADEREFWATHDTTDYLDWSQATRAVFPNLRPSTETISLRLPAPLLADLKTLANERDVPYQSLLKVYLAEQVRQEQAAAGQHDPRLQPKRRKRVGRGPSPDTKADRARRTPRR